LLLIEHSPATEQRVRWADEIDEFRDRLERKLSPTIRRRLKRAFADVFARARRRVQRKMARHGETRAAAALPEDCPYTHDQVLGDWLPRDGPRHPD
jgi:transposase InsO family protein